MIKLIFRDGVERGSRLVEHENRRVAVQRTGQKKLLLLAAGEVDRVFKHLLDHFCFALFRKLLNALPDAGLPEDAFQLIMIDILFLAQADVPFDRHGQEMIVLIDGGKERIVGIAAVFTCWNAVYQNAPGGRLVKPTEDFDTGGFASSVFADDGDLFTGIYRKAHLLQGEALAFLITEVDVLEGNGAGKLLLTGQRMGALQFCAIRHLQKRPEVVAFCGDHVEILELLGDAENPCGKARDDSKIKDEIGHAHRTAQNTADQIDVGNRLPQQGEKRASGAGGKDLPCVLADYLRKGGGQLCKNEQQPVSRPIKADILAGSEVVRILIEIVEAYPEGIILLARLQLCLGGITHQQEFSNAGCGD